MLFIPRHFPASLEGSRQRGVARDRKNDRFVQLEACGIQQKAGRALLHVADDAVGADQSIENRQHVAAVLDHARENIS